MIKRCYVGEYLDYENCKCRKKLVDKLVDEGTNIVEEVKQAKITLAKNENSCTSSSYTAYTGVFRIFFTTNVGGVGDWFVYFYWYLKKEFKRF